MPTLSAKSGKPLGRPRGSKTAKVVVAEAPQAPLTAEDRQALATGRMMTKFMARYDAAGRGRRMAGWQTPSSGPNAATQGLQTIRDRSHDLVRNDWSGESAVTKWGTTLVGIGITPRFKRVKAKKRKQEITDLWVDFCKEADADCVLDLYGLQTLVVHAWAEAGECFARRRPRFPDEGFKVPMQIQVLEADMCPIFNSDSYDGLPKGHLIKDGIEFNKRGRRVAFWFYKEHPGDDPTSFSGGSGSSPAADALVRVLAEDVAHIFRPKRPGQRRGVSLMAPIVTRIRNIGDYEDATLERQKLANLWVGFITRTLPEFNTDDIESDAVSGVARVVDEAGQGLLPLKPGLFQELEDGQDVKFANPPEAGTNYSDYMRSQHLGSAAGVHMPYELFSGDIAGVSDRTLRVIINEFRRLAEQLQWQIVIPQFCQRAVDWFVEAAALNGDIGLDEMDDVRRVEHAPHGWAYIHPVQDPQGKKLEIEAGMRSRSSVIGEKGDDPEAVDDERAVDDMREQTLKIGPYSEAAKLAVAGAGGTAPAKGDDDGIDNDEYSGPPNARSRGTKS